jgi:hypothetical protein
LGDDADQFTSETDKLATVEDGEDGLLGGDYSDANVGGQEMSGFESSFPAIDTSNDVRCCLPSRAAHRTSWPMKCLE